MCSLQTQPHIATNPQGLTTVKMGKGRPSYPSLLPKLKKGLQQDQAQEEPQERQPRLFQKKQGFQGGRQRSQSPNRGDRRYQGERNNSQNSYQNQNRQAQRQRDVSQIKCYHCNKYGHKKRDCFKYKALRERRLAESQSQAQNYMAQGQPDEMSREDHVAWMHAQQVLHGYELNQQGQQMEEEYLNGC